MKIRNVANGGEAEVSDEYGKALIEAGLWEAADAPKKAAPARAPRTPKKTAQKTPQTQK